MLIKHTPLPPIYFSRIFIEQKRVRFDGHTLKWYLYYGLKIN